MNDKRHKFKWVLFAWASLQSSPTFAEQRIYQTDRYGNIEYNKPSYTVKDNGRVIEADKYGNPLYNKDGYQIKGDRIYQTDKYGNIQYHKPSLTRK